MRILPRKLIVTLVLVCLIAPTKSQKKQIAAYFLSKELDPKLQLTACIALKEMSLLRQQSFDEGTMILPTDTAWAKTTENCRWFKALMADQNSELRQELMLEVGTTNPGEWEEFYYMVVDYPFVDAASGNVYFIDVETDIERPQLCLADWEDGDYKATEECAEMQLPPINNSELLGQQYIYKVDDVILPESLRDKLDEAALNYSCDLDEIPTCDSGGRALGEAESAEDTYELDRDLYGSIEHSDDYLQNAMRDEFL